MGRIGEVPHMTRRNGPANVIGHMSVSSKRARREAESTHCYTGDHEKCSGCVRRNHGLILKCECMCHKRKTTEEMGAIIAA